MGVFGYDLTDPALYDSGFPHRVFTGIRRDCPVAWHDPAEFGPVTDGFWSIAGYAQVVEVLGRCDTTGQVPDTLVEDAFALCVLELARRPAAWHALRTEASLLATAVDELARWVSPVAAVWCQAPEELVLGRHRIAPGERLACWIPSANRDDTEFGRDAMDLRLDRTPNPHLTFHGAPTARAELLDQLTDLVTTTDELVLAGEPEWVRSVERSALRSLPVELVVRS